MRSFSIFSIIKHRKKRHLRHNPYYLRISKTIIKGLVLAFAAFFMVVLLLGGYAYANLTANLPSLEQLPVLLDRQNGLLLQPTRLYDRSGQNLLLTLDNPGFERHFLSVNPADAQHFSPLLIQTVISLYEPDFWNSSGINWLHPLDPQANTLAERLVNSLLLDNEPADFRHALRMKLLALQVTERFGKVQVLEWYLNSLYCGHYAYGMDNAARLYLGKSAADLNLSDTALLLAVSESPALNPLDVPTAINEPYRRLLANLLQTGAIGTDEYALALQTQLNFLTSPGEVLQNAPAFNALVMRQLEPYLSARALERGGIKVITTLDDTLQTQLTCTLRSQLLKLEDQSTLAASSGTSGCEAALLLPSLPPLSESLPPDLQGSALILDIQNGDILALSGDMTVAAESAALSARNPGTLLTPFIALAAFSKGYNPSSLVWDIPDSFPPAVPQSYHEDISYHGPLRLRTAVNNDYMAPILQLLNQLGPENVWRIAAPLGLHLTGGNDTHALMFPYEGSQTSLVDIAAAYSAIAGMGTLTGQSGSDGQIVPNAVLRLESWDGRVILERSQPQSSAIISAPLAYLTHNVLADEDSRRVSLGYPNWLDIGRPAAAKIGTTADQKEVWTVGYTPYRLTAVRINLSGTSEATTRLDYHASAGVWNALMQYTHQSLPPDDWSQPAGISNVDVCDPSGLLPTRYCPAVVKEVFLSGNEPGGYDTLYRSYAVNRETGRLATVFTPLDMVEERVFLVPPPEARAWAQSTGLQLPPDAYDNIQITPASADANINSPALFAFIHGQQTVTGSAAGKDFSTYHLQVGQGLNPASWQTLENRSNSAVTNSTLAEWDTSAFDDGLYALRLTVIKNDNSIQTAITQVTVDNTPPQVHLINPQPGQVFHANGNTTLNFTAEIRDESGVQRVEWYLDGTLAGRSNQAPYVLVWPARSGEHTLSLKAFDLAGNQTVSSNVNFKVAP